MVVVKVPGVNIETDSDITAERYQHSAILANTEVIAKTSTRAWGFMVRLLGVGLLRCVGFRTDYSRRATDRPTNLEHVTLLSHIPTLTSNIV